MPMLTYSSECIHAHSIYRQEVGVPPLEWSDELAFTAQRWANFLARNSLFKHSKIKRSGENIAMGTGSYTNKQFVDMWGEEKKLYIPGGVFPDISADGDWGSVAHYNPNN